MSRTEVAFWVLLLLVTAFRVVTTKPHYPEGKQVRVTARVEGDPVLYNRMQMVKAAGLAVYLPRFPEVSYGDTIVIEGFIKEGKLTNAQLIEVRPSQQVLYKLRASLMRVFVSTLPEPHASLLAGMVLGAKSNLPKDFKDDLKGTGTLHVVVASGMNVTLVAKFLLAVALSAISRRRAVLVATVGVWCYALVAGFDAPIIRAALMGTLAFGAQATGRLYTAWRALFISAAGMLIVSPLWLGDVGFLLSFSATASLLMFESRFAKMLRFVPGIIREGLATSLAAQVFVAPILYATFGQFQPLSPLINALVLWVVPPATVLGFIGAFVGLAYLPVGHGILLLTYPFSWWFTQVVGLFS